LQDKNKHTVLFAVSFYAVRVIKGG